MKSAIRRHHAGRLKQKRRYYWFGNNYRRYSWEKPVVMDARTVGKVFQTPHPCSCAGCGSPRRIGELTRQEIRVRDEILTATMRAAKTA